MKKLLTLTLTMGLLFAEEKADSLGNNLPLEPTRTISFTTDEGTWMSLDVSPDGKSIIFDLVGDLYSIPFRGGEAKRITSGIAFDSQPVFSPNGEMISFISDRGGSENLWVADLDGSNPKQLTKSTDGQFASPVFSNDGNYVYVSQTSWPARTFEIWMYHIKGGSGIQITKAKASPTTP
ncbi:MAG: amidohydrolase, partial [Candidatus Marinimicrobia bacterium]|nr:amidohydrolase [Candidatus Neomarinimicrobiota bacterium]